MYIRTIKRPYDEVIENDYNLSVSTYVEQEDGREKINIVKLNAQIEGIVACDQVLREEIAKIIAELRCEHEQGIRVFDVSGSG